MKARAQKSNPAIPIPTTLNISALAREHGVSRKTITRRLAKGWRPGAAPTPRTPAHLEPVRPVRKIPIRDMDRATIPRIAQELSVSRNNGAPLREPLGMVRGVLLLLAVAFYVLIALAAVHR